MPHHGMVWYGKSNSLPIPFLYHTIPKRFGMVWEIGKFPKRHFGITCYSQPLPKVSVFPNLIWYKIKTKDHREIKTYNINYYTLIDINIYKKFKKYIKSIIYSLF